MHVSSLTQYFEYVPIMLLTLLITAESKLGHKLQMTMCNSIVILIILGVLYIFTKTIGFGKYTIISIAIILWIVFIRLKHTHLNSFLERE